MQDGGWANVLAVAPVMGGAARAPAHGVEDETLRPGVDGSAHTGAASPADPSVELPGVGRVALALVVVIGAIFLLRAAARKFVLLPGGLKANRAVRVLSRSVLAPKQHVVLLQVGKRVLVVGDSAGRLNPLCEISDPDEVASLVSLVQHEKAEPKPSAFGNLFGKAQGAFPDEPDGRDPLVELPGDASSVEPVNDGELADLGNLLERVRTIQQQIR